MVKVTDFTFDVHVPSDSLEMTLTKFLKKGGVASHVIPLNLVGGYNALTERLVSQLCFVQFS